MPVGNEVGHFRMAYHANKSLVKIKNSKNIMKHWRVLALVL